MYLFCQVAHYCSVVFIDNKQSRGSPLVFLFVQGVELVETFRNVEKVKYDSSVTE